MTNRKQLTALSMMSVLFPIAIALVALALCRRGELVQCAFGMADAVGPTIMIWVASSVAVGVPVLVGSVATMEPRAISMMFWACVFMFAVDAIAIASGYWVPIVSAGFHAAMLWNTRPRAVKTAP
jgi:hypothetical protein